MRPRVVINYITGSLLIIIFVTGVKMSLNDADRYGWDYSRTISIGTDIFIEKVSISVQLYTEAFILISGVMLIVTGLELSRRGVDNTYHLSNTADIVFVPTKPTNWDIWYDPHTHTAGVILDGVGMSFPLTMFEKWMTKDGEAI